MARRSLGLLLMLVILLYSLGQSSALALGVSKAQTDNQSQMDKISLVFPDYLERSKIIGNYEELVRQSPDSFLFLRLLAAQYLRRFRETADVEDLLRSEQAARRSLAVQPAQNGVSSMLLASTLLSQHRFQEALQVATAAQVTDPNNVSIATLKASILMELGDYEASNQLLQTLVNESDSGHHAVTARYLELTHHLTSARQVMDSAMQQMDEFYTNPAETRAWFHVRAGDLAFTAGDFTLSEQRYREALDLFPQDVAAFTGLARLYAAQHRWQEALEIANKGTERIPLVETLAYQADAQRALGDQEGATATEALIEVVAHLSKVKGIYDRALAVYYVEHGIHLLEALEIARREVAVRDDIYAEDTLAWAAAANGYWQEAQQAARQATRYGTEDALLQFHHGMIAMHCGDREEAIDRLAQALKLNPRFHHKYADEARRVLAALSPTSVPSYSSQSHLVS
ncbi:MAG: tetratricopeptide repeat protein [Plectolyngbya sp. WJT66-NPBG17]|nr:tetratricopeptide repeat protein [Plectolyngbya sp. WJT66-NPBG17]MBW4528164.1 tetratricopeptide repeat protein [Phormidium tanganyikae FI6-MK23]